MLLIGLSGKRRSGKSLLGNILRDNYTFEHLALATELKKEMRTIYYLTEEQTDGALKEVVDPRYDKTPRQMMIEHGKKRRDENPEYWISKVADHILKTPQAQMGRYVISDIRFENEAAWIKRHGGLLIRLERAPELTGDYIDDVSETELDHYGGFNWRVPESWNVDENDMYANSAMLILKIKEWGVVRV